MKFNPFNRQFIHRAQLLYYCSPGWATKQFLDMTRDEVAWRMSRGPKLALSAPEAKMFRWRLNMSEEKWQRIVLAIKMENL